MVKYEDECVSCGLPCLGTACPNRNVPHYFCNNCGEEIDPDEMYSDGEYDYCHECAVNMGLVEEEEEDDE